MLPAKAAACTTFTFPFREPYANISAGRSTKPRISTRNQAPQPVVPLGEADFLVLTLWESEDAIRKFAGNDIDRARYYPQDTQYFEELEPNVAHYAVVIDTLKR